MNCLLSKLNCHLKFYAYRGISVSSLDFLHSSLFIGTKAKTNPNSKSNSANLFNLNRLAHYCYTC